MEIVTLREFARRVGVSLTAIQKGVKNGRIEAITDPATGKITGIDYATQATAWTANSKHPLLAVLLGVSMGMIGLGLFQVWERRRKRRQWGV